MSTSAPSKVSFTIRRPTPASRAASSGADSDTNNPSSVAPIPRHLANDSTPGSPLARSANASPKRSYSELDSSDDDDEQINDELVTGFDKFGVQRCVSSLYTPPPSFPRSGSQLTSALLYNSDRKHENKKKQPQGPLIIPALKDRDWRELARKRKSINRYVPASAKAQTGTDGSVGGLGTKDTINSGPQLSGIQIKEKRLKVETDEDKMQVTDEEIVKEEVKEEEETEDQKAMRAILAGTNGQVHDGPIVDVIIPQGPISETDAYRQDVQEFPDEATLDDYARVPVSQFGAALLRGMGWKEGSTTTTKGKKNVEPWLPTARPALLGIGAKEQEVLDDGSGKGKSKGGVKVKRYVPLVKKERDGSGSGTGSGRESRRQSPPSRRESAPASRRASRSPSPRRRHRERDYDDRKRDYGNGRERDRDRDMDKHRRDYDRDRDRHRGGDGDRRDRRDKRDY